MHALHLCCVLSARSSSRTFFECSHTHTFLESKRESLPIQKHHHTTTTREKKVLFQKLNGLPAIMMMMKMKKESEEEERKTWKSANGEKVEKGRDLLRGHWNAHTQTHTQERYHVSSIALLIVKKRLKKSFPSKTLTFIHSLSLSHSLIAILIIEIYIM